MNYSKAYALFEKLIFSAEEELYLYSKSFSLSPQHKADKTLVTACDKAIDNILTQIALDAGLQVVSEEGDHILGTVKSGNYMTIDPIDGTLGYIEYMNYTVEHGGVKTFLQKDLGAASDFCLLLGIVENGIPMYGAVYNFITKEKIFVDGNNKMHLVRKNNSRNYTQRYAVYVDQRPGDRIEQELVRLPDVAVIKQAALGLKSIYTIINPHEAVVTVHRVQKAGLWDIMPAAVAARAFGGHVYDDKGGLLKLDQYIILPGNGATIVRGKRFAFVSEKLLL